MTQETYDWSSDYTDEQSGGTTTFTSQTGDTVNVTVSQTATGGGYVPHGDGYESQVQGGDSSGHFQMEMNASGLSDTSTTTIDFSNNSFSGGDSVSDLSFTLYDLDAPSSGGYQDQVTVYAYDESGNLLPVTMTAVDFSVVSVSGNTATAVVGGGSGGSQVGNVANTSTEGNVNVSISGEVAQLVIVYGKGPDANANPTPQQIGISDLSMDLQPAVICFTKGTLILTPHGNCPIEGLSIGDLVMTADRGPQPVRWIGQRRIAGRDSLAPVRFAPGTLGNDRALLLSPQHRLLISGWRVELSTGWEEALVAAKHLVNGRDIVQVPMAEVTYYHLMTDRHDIVFANGTPCESLFLSEMALNGMGAGGRREIQTLFPDLVEYPVRYGSTVRPCLQEYEVRALH